MARRMVANAAVSAGESSRARPTEVLTLGWLAAHWPDSTTSPRASMGVDTRCVRRPQTTPFAVAAYVRLRGPVIQLRLAPSGACPRHRSEARFGRSYSFRAWPIHGRKEGHHRSPDYRPNVGALGCGRLTGEMVNFKTGEQPEQDVDVHLR
jgi:hypothetical protein